MKSSGASYCFRTCEVPKPGIQKTPKSLFGKLLGTRVTKPSSWSLGWGKSVCPRDLFPLSLDVTIAPVNIVKASTRQRAEGQPPRGFDKTERVFIPDCNKAPFLVHKGKICTKYLSLSKKKPNPTNVWTQSIFNVMYRNFSNTGWGIVSEKGKTFQTARFQNPFKPCGVDGQMFC